MAAVEGDVEGVIVYGAGAVGGSGAKAAVKAIRGADKAVDAGKALDRASDASRAIAGTSKPGAARGIGALLSGSGKSVHKNSRAYVGQTHVYRIKLPDGKTYKIGESARGVRKRDGASIRAESQVRKLNRQKPGHESEIRKRFSNKAEARDYERKVIERFRRRYGQDSLPGNKSNH